MESLNRELIEKIYNRALQLGVKEIDLSKLNSDIHKISSMTDSEFDEMIFSCETEKSKRNKENTKRSLLSVELSQMNADDKYTYTMYDEDIKYDDKKYLKRHIKHSKNYLEKN